MFYVGERALLVSNWPVHSEATRDLTTELFSLQAREPGMSRAEALRRSSLDVADRGVYRDESAQAVFAYAHPLFWAPFSVVGDGR